MKITLKQRLKAVKELIAGKPLTYPETHQTHDLKKQFRRYAIVWKAKYLKYGIKGFQLGRRGKWTAKEKLDAIMPIISNEIGFLKQAEKLAIDEGTLLKWIQIYREKGVSGLECSKRGRKPENMKEKTDNKEQKTSQANSNEKLKDRIAVLEHENLLMQAEIDYLKKLQALVEKRGTSTKQKSSMNSAKAKNTKKKSNSANGSKSPD